jgi:hypothetical protein
MASSATILGGWRVFYSKNSSLLQVRLGSDS